MCKKIARKSISFDNCDLLKNFQDYYGERYIYHFHINHFRHFSWLTTWVVKEKSIISYKTRRDFIWKKLRWIICSLVSLFIYVSKHIWLQKIFAEKTGNKFCKNFHSLSVQFLRFEMQISTSAFLYIRLLLHTSYAAQSFTIFLKYTEICWFRNSEKNNRLLRAPLFRFSGQKKFVSYHSKLYV